MWRNVPGWVQSVCSSITLENCMWKTKREGCVHATLKLYHCLSVWKVREEKSWRPDNSGRWVIRTFVPYWFTDLIKSACLLVLRMYFVFGKKKCNGWLSSLPFLNKSIETVSKTVKESRSTDTKQTSLPYVVDTLWGNGRT